MFPVRGTDSDACHRRQLVGKPEGDLRGSGLLAVGQKASLGDGLPGQVGRAATERAHAPPPSRRNVEAPVQIVSRSQNRRCDGQSGTEQEHRWRQVKADGCCHRPRIPGGDAPTAAEAIGDCLDERQAGLVEAVTSVVNWQPAECLLGVVQKHHVRTTPQVIDGALDCLPQPSWLQRVLGRLARAVPREVADLGRQSELPEQVGSDAG